MPYPTNPVKKVILFLPSGEYHETGLLVLHYLLKQKNVEVIYLGANVPLTDVEIIAQTQKPDYLQLHITAPTRSFNLPLYIKELNKNVKNIPVIASGSLTIDEKSVAGKVQYIQNFAAMQAFIDTFSY